MENIEREFGWNDTIEKDGGEFVILPEGDYSFTVTKFTRGRFPGSDKMPACPKAELELTIDRPEHGKVVVFHSLLLHSKTEGLLSNFFAGIGQKKKGQRIAMNWDLVPGATGRCKLSINTYTSTKTGEVLKNNKVKSFYEKELFQSQPQVGGYVPGQF